MTIGILKETNDKRVAVVPDTIKKFKGLGLDIMVESGAGEQAYYPDTEYQEAGAQMASHTDILQKADVIISIIPLEDAELQGIAKG
ncbi:MAG: NAD(P)(+) transhydrogenase (Re/Si-specific) subunit alpha, partial [Lewinella sp.]|nr:NAD(P)(+) transhydrogenase (Re/Si-specific) subunit alpha [Lewinella sp.]